MLANVISERRLPVAISFQNEADYKSIIDAAAEDISAVAFNTNLYSEDFVIKAAEYAKSKNLYVLSDCALSADKHNARLCAQKHFSFADGITITTFFGEESVQEFIFEANSKGKDIFIYSDSKKEFVKEVSGQSLSLSGFSNIGTVIDSKDKEYVDNIRAYLPSCVFWVKNFRKSIAESYFTRYCEGAIIEIAVSSLSDIEKIKKLDINNLIRRNKIFLWGDI